MPPPQNVGLSVKGARFGLLLRQAQR